MWYNRRGSASSTLAKIAMVTFLFWNTNGKAMEAEVSTLAQEHRVDIIILSELTSSPASMLQALNRAEAAEFHYAPGQCERIRIFTRFSSRFLEPVYESISLSIRRLGLPARTEILVVAAHLPSKLFQSDSSQISACVELARTIREQEEKIGHTRTLVVGDLNMNPFEHGMVTANGMNAAMSRQIASRKTRTVQSREYPFFFNPMWAHLGDRSGHPPGTYYYSHSEFVNYYWNVFDQVLVRPDIIDHFETERIKLLTAVGRTSLLREDGRPDVRNFSDHLPLLFEIEL